MSDQTKRKGIIFDMDNTLLQSRIDFKAMKMDLFRYFVREQVLPEEFTVEEHTTSTMIEYARAKGLSAEHYEAAMKLAEKHELAGMEGAGLEPGARELLEALAERYMLVVITNNSFAAAVKALELTGIAGYFDLTIGREQMSALKPSPSGFLFALEQFSHIPAGEWISIGDAWIDGRASQDAGIAFISYRTSDDVMRAKRVAPVGRLMELKDLHALIE
ncbi:HAD family hydrolase [Paenibacillus cremeus]|uniref:HAD-IA family hydrolase n=1 Tax=Paenibacillus cremeus TaxID=2163881 RepID=A0A559KEI7_9BACL|nr:HAD-IA family hydrolase [Paenibacillus cremeus]TVY10542.1 HAD-IA family hydrolase [Paenibacillus cremeus]